MDRSFVYEPLLPDPSLVDVAMNTLRPMLFAARRHYDNAESLAMAFDAVA